MVIYVGGVRVQFYKMGFLIIILITTLIMIIYLSLINWQVKKFKYEPSRYYKIMGK